MTPANDHSVTSQALSEALWMRTEIDRFSREFERSPATRTPMPIWSWEQLERQLSSLASGPATRAILPELISAVRKQSRWLPPEMVLREVLCTAFAVMDGDFNPAPPTDGSTD